MEPNRTRVKQHGAWRLSGEDGSSLDDQPLTIKLELFVALVEVSRSGYGPAHLVKPRRCMALETRLGWSSTTDPVRPVEGTGSGAQGASHCVPRGSELGEMQQVDRGSRDGGDGRGGLVGRIVESRGKPCVSEQGSKSIFCHN